MATFSMSTTINAPAEKVWETISDFNGLPKFVSAIAKSTMEGSGVGAVRTLTFKEGGAPIVERLESRDDQARILSYSIMDSPLPMEGYVSTMEVRDLGQGRCELTWSSRFEPKGASEEEAKEIIKGVYSAGFEGLKEMYAG